MSTERSDNSTPVLIVTGGGRGIGAATARLAGQRGYNVCINYRNDEDSAGDVARDIVAWGRRAMTYRADVGDEGQVRVMFQEVDRQLGPVTALVNNAGRTGHVSRFVDADHATIRSVVEVNLLGAMWCARQAISRMSTDRGGTGGAIVNVSTGAATIGSPGEYVWYAAAKGGVDSLTLGLAKELASEGIRVNGVAPGIVNTEIHVTSGRPERLDRVAKATPMGRAGEPSEIAEAILWLLSPAASYTTGAILRVAGGR
ncbi:MAG: SDR family oxidoreductase [Pseudomonadota bacterium]